MDRTTNYRKSQARHSADNLPHDAYNAGEFAEKEFPEINLNKGDAANKQAEQSNPKFRLFMEKLRRAARAVGRNVKMFLVLALTLGIVKHR